MHKCRPSSIVAGALLSVMTVAAAASAQNTAGFTDPFPPFRIAGNLYYVGSKGLANYLITTPAGPHPHQQRSRSQRSADSRASVEKLGFKFNDIKILLISHAHWDHDAGSAMIKQIDRREVHGDGRRRAGRRIRRQDRLSVRERRRRSLSADEGRSRAARRRRGQARRRRARRASHARPHEGLHDVDDEGERGRRRPTTSSSSAAPTSTPATSWSATLLSADRHGLRADVPGLEVAARATFFSARTAATSTWKPKYARMKDGAASPFIDPDGYKKYVTAKEQEFRGTLSKQREASTPGIRK